MADDIKRNKWGYPLRCVSASQLTLYLQCRLKWNLSKHGPREEPSGPMLVGSAGHQVLEAYLKLPVAERTEEMIERYIAKYALPKKADQGNMQRSIRKYYREFGPDELIVPTSIEAKHEVLLYDDVYLVGTFDWENVNGGNTVVIGEHKFAMKEIDVEEKVWWTPQPLVYYFMAQKLWPEKELTRSVHTLLWPMGVERVERSGFLPDEWLEFIPYLAREMMDVSPAIPTYGYHCKWCPARKQCMRKLKAGIDEKMGVIPDWMRV